MAQKKGEKAEDAKKDETASAAEQENMNREDERQAQAERAEQAEEVNAQREQERPAEREETNPVSTQMPQADYDPTGQLTQPGQPLHSTDPEEQARYEMQRREAVLRAQQGERLTEDSTMAPAAERENREHA